MLSGHHYYNYTENLHTRVGHGDDLALPWHGGFRVEVDDLMLRNGLPGGLAGWSADELHRAILHHFNAYEVDYDILSTDSFRNESKYCQVIITHVLVTTALYGPPPGVTRTVVLH